MFDKCNRMFLCTGNLQSKQLAMPTSLATSQSMFMIKKKGNRNTWPFFWMHTQGKNTGHSENTLCSLSCLPV